MTMIKKAVFPIAGVGTRFLPMTKAMPKEMLPIIDKPIIQYAVEEAIAAGITELIFITNNKKDSIKQHFYENIDLIKFLEQKENYKAIETIKKIIPDNIKCHYVIQNEALGLGHAVYLAKDLIVNEDFAVLLADDLIAADKPCLKTMIEKHNKTKSSILAVEKINPKDSSKYGIVDLKDNINKELKNIVEKPKPKNAPSDLGVVGRYILNNSIFKYLEKVRADKTGEIQLTSAIAELLQTESVYAYEFDGKRYDCGNKSQYVQAIVDFSKQRDDINIII